MFGAYLLAPDHGGRRRDRRRRGRRDGGRQLELFLIAVWAFVALTQAFTACVVATLYYYLRRDKEGIDLEQIAAVFD